MKDKELLLRCQTVSHVCDLLGLPHTAQALREIVQEQQALWAEGRTVDTGDTSSHAQFQMDDTNRKGGTFAPPPSDLGSSFEVASANAPDL